MQQLQDPNQRNVDNLNNVTCEASNHFRNKNKENLKAKIEEHETNREDKKYQRLVNMHHDFKNGSPPRNNYRLPQHFG
jgi:hypothetical protein